MFVVSVLHLQSRTLLLNQTYSLKIISIAYNMIEKDYLFIFILHNKIVFVSALEK